MGIAFPSCFPLSELLDQLEASPLTAQAVEVKENNWTLSHPSQNFWLCWETTVIFSPKLINYNLRAKLLELWILLLSLVTANSNILYGNPFSSHSSYLWFSGNWADAAWESCLEIFWIRYDPKINGGTWFCSAGTFLCASSSLRADTTLYKSLNPLQTLVPNFEQEGFSINNCS